MNITKKSDKIKTSVVEKIRKGYSFMGEKKKHSNMTTLMGAAFLMATSAIGPGFLTQTSTFTAQYKSIFALVIICTILLDVTTQLNIWSVIGVSGMRGQDIANKVLPGLGYFIAFMVALGGLAFNIGNVGGGALGLNVLFGIPTTVGTFIAGIIGILIFLSKDAKASMDKLTKYLGSIMIIVVLYVAIKSKPPVGDAVSSIFHPGDVGALVLPLITLLGGSCGGYITFSGAHRLLDAGGQADERHAVVIGVTDHRGVIARAASQGAAVAHLLLHVADHGTFGHLAQGNHVAHADLGLLAAIHALASVHALRSEEQLLVHLVVVPRCIKQHKKGITGF